MKQLTTMNEYTAAKQGKSVLMFSATWCGDCRFLDPFMPEIEAKFSDWSFYYVDRDEWMELAQELDIFGIPSFVAFNGGQEVDRYVGRERKTPEQVEAFLHGLG
ncbi:MULTISPECIES: thioredoxin family protein [Exiguobacterium]|uniref:thioredoxin family protein n=1 Tax=Exiguobacterium TaxID=33986 RepID=UPI001BE7D57B|nr:MULTISPECIES: thioredoxin family protein [Exiguobacterium]MCT4777471.1 thioredoxin family protein [Exiguobacterium aquaticum]MCT4790549.1 thioredoxin family protein [Exiguobacterium mexicanum]